MNVQVNLTETDAVVMRISNYAMQLEAVIKSMNEVLQANAATIEDLEADKRQATGTIADLENTIAVKDEIITADANDIRRQAEQMDILRETNTQLTDRLTLFQELLSLANRKIEELEHPTAE